jgi:hypothetical protein
MLRKGLLALALGLLACASSRESVAVERLKGAWFSDGPSFELVVHDRTILFEFDMKEHAYHLDGDRLTVSFDDGEQLHRIIRLTDEEMEWETEATGRRSVLYRKGAWERSHAPQQQPAAGDPTTKQGWSSYRNEKYGYEIQYPEGVEVRETGPESKRDGATIRLGFKEHAAPQPVLDIYVAPRTPEEKFPSRGTDVSAMALSVADVTVGSDAGRLAQYRWKESGDLAFAEAWVRGVVLRFDANAGVRDLRETQWWEIISSFRLRDRALTPVEAPSP